MNRWRQRAAPLGGHSLQLLRGGDELFPAMLAAIAAAEDEVWLASYIVHTDDSSLQIAQALAAAARRGVRVRVVVDGFGARHALPFWQQHLEGSGAALAVFRPINRWWHWMQPGQLRRLHQKLCVVDQTCAFVGGINLMDDRFDLHHGVLAAPRLDFAVRFCGPLVSEVQLTVRRLWGRSWLGRDFGDELRAALTETEPLARARQWVGERLGGWVGRRWRAWHGARVHAQALAHERRHMAANPQPVQMAFVQRDNLRRRHAIEREYLHALREARHGVDLICPYFYPSARLLRALMAAARRGVKVRLLLQGQVDYRLAALAAQALYAELLARGVQVFEYRAAFLHAKVAQVDGLWATVGSSNLDPTSLLLNLEANVLVWDAGFASGLRTAFETALQGAQEVLPTTPMPGWRGWRGWLRRSLLAWAAQVYLRAAGGGSPY
jgi:cardiolipin synthase A/B